MRDEEPILTDRAVTGHGPPLIRNYVMADAREDGASKGKEPRELHLEASLRDEGSVARGEG